MDIRKLIAVIRQLGILITGLACLWWAVFYRMVLEEIGGDWGDAFKCLFSSGGECGMITGLASLMGETPYNPMAFWVGVVLLGVAIVLQLSLKDAKAVDSLESLDSQSSSLPMDFDDSNIDPDKLVICPFCETKREGFGVCRGCGNTVDKWVLNANRPKT